MKRKLLAVLAIVALCSGFGLTATAATKLRAITAPGIAAVATNLLFVAASRQVTDPNRCPA